MEQAHRDGNVRKMDKPHDDDDESYTLTVPPMGVKFGTSVPTFVQNFNPIGATCRPCGAKNLKIGLCMSKLDTGGLRCAQCCR